MDREHPGVTREYRRKTPPWDRVKILLLLTLIGQFSAWSKTSDPFVTFPEALREVYSGLFGQWLLLLMGVEVLRQVHYLISEHWSGYHLFWKNRVFAGTERQVTEHVSDWTRYRIRRVVKWTLIVTVYALVVTALVDDIEHPAQAVIEAPRLLVSILPFFLYLIFIVSIVVMQFVAIFWFLSKGGVDVYYPEDIETRFDQVWGQDHVLEMIRESIAFLQRPDEIEEKGGYLPGGVLLWGPPGTGKTLMAEAIAGEVEKPFVFVDPGAFAQPLTAGVLTPSGWRKMGELRPGDEVIGRDGRPHRVLGVYPQGTKDIYRVTFDDGGATRVTAEHLWAVQTSWLREIGGDRWFIRETQELERLHRGRKKGWRYSIPLVQPVDFAPRELPLHPYVLGALLGDGCFTGCSIMLVNTDDRLIDRVRGLLPPGVTVSGSGPRYRLIGQDAGGRSRLRTILTELGLDGRLAPDKLIPPAYLYGTVQDRLELLRGLMDTDGAVSPSASGKTFSTSSPRLRDDVVELVRSLGGLVKVSEGSTPSKKPFWHLHVRLPNEVNPFWVKAERVVPRSVPIRRFITSIEPDGREEAQCILVDAPDHLYVTDDYVVTHNTNMFMGVGILKVKSLFRKLRKLSLKFGGVVVFFDEADSLGSRGALAQGGPWQPSVPGALTSCNGLGYLSPGTQEALIEAFSPAEEPSTPAPRPRLLDRIIMGAGMGGGGGMGTLQALLSEISGLKKPRGLTNRLRRMLGMRPKPPPKYRILIMMATNMPQALDEALLRPGRIDRIYKVPYPSKEGRLETLKGYLAKVPNDVTPEEVDRLAVMTPYYSGAKIKDLINEALILAIRDDHEVVTFRDLWRAKALKELGPPENVEYVERERHAVAVHEACHAVTAHLLRTHMAIDVVTIEKHSQALGMVKNLPVEDRYTQWKTEYETDVKVSLASLAGERMFFTGDSSSGVSGDLQSASQLAALMEGAWGMGDGITSFFIASRHMLGPGSDPTQVVLERMTERVENRLKGYYEDVEQLLSRHREDILRLAVVLEERKTISGDEVGEILGVPPGLYAGAAAREGQLSLLEPDGHPVDGEGLMSADGEVDGEPAPAAEPVPADD